MPPKTLNLEAPGTELLKEALQGPNGYGVPKYLRGYPLVGRSAGVLNEVFEINDHPKSDSVFPALSELEFRDKFLGLAIWSMSWEFWDRFFPRFFAALRNEELGWRYVNTWHPKKGVKITVYQTSEGEYFHIPLRTYDDPYSLLIRTNKVLVRTGNVTAEKKARKNLLSHLNRRQRKELILTGCFVEVGKNRTNYRIRFNRPTIAFRETKGKEGLRYEEFVGSYCLHSLGYYYGTFAGVMAPSDEMLAHLLMIRADEIDFLKEANKHGLEDPLGGVS